MKRFRAELHLHTVHSACAEVEMIPPLIVQRAMDDGINLIAVTDHNATANIAAVQKAALGYNLTVLPGMEVQTREDVHCLCLFDTLEQAAAWQAVVDAHLPNLVNRPDFFGEQYVVDETGDFIRSETRLLAISTNISLDDACRQVTELGGLFIPAHVNRTTNGLLPILGFVPQGIPIAALEISLHITPDQALSQFPQIAGYPLIQNGDVHMLDSMLGANEFFLEDVSIAEIRQALKQENGRSHKILLT